MKLSQVFRKARAKMWDGVNPRSTRSRYLCDNILGARVPWDDAIRAKNIVQNLIGGHFTGSLVRHVFEAITLNAGITVHVTVLDGRDPHHIVEAQFKALARALRAAVARDARVGARNWAACAL